MLETFFTKANPNNLLIQDVLGRVNFFLAALAAPFFASFAIHFPKTSLRFSRAKELLFFLPAVILAILSLLRIFFTFRVVHGKVVYFSTPYYWIYIGILIIYFIVVAVGVLVYKYFRSRGISKLQLLYILIGYSVTISIMLADSVANAVTDINDYYDSWINNAALIFLGLCAFSMIKYRLFGLRFLVRRGAAIGFTLFILFFFYTYLILSAQHLFPEFKVSEPSATIAVVILIVISYPLLGKLARRFVNGLFAESKALRRERVQRKTQSFTEKTNFLSLFRELAKNLQGKLKVKDIRGLRLDQKEGYVQEFPVEAKLKKTFYRNHALIALVRNPEHLLVREEIPFLLQDVEQGEREQLLEAEKLLHILDAEIVVLLGLEDTAPALLVVGEKSDGTIYTTEEIALVKELCSEFSTDFQNFFMYQQALRRVGVEI